jgi:hypothetical protein
MGKFAAGMYGTGVSFRLVCGFDIGWKYRLWSSWIFTALKFTTFVDYAFDLH